MTGRSYRNVLMLFFLNLVSIPGFGQDNTITLDSRTKTISVSELSEWTVDKTNSWFEHGIEASQRLQTFESYRRNAFVYRQDTTPPIIRFNLTTHTLSSTEFVLHLRNTEIDHIQLLIINDAGEIWKSKTIGDAYPFHERYFSDRILAIPFQLESNQNYTCYLGINKPNRVISSIIEISERRHWESQSRKLNLVYGLSLGSFLAFMLIGFALFTLLRQATYLYYALYVLAVFLVLLSVHGYSFQLLYPEHPVVSRYFMQTFQYLAFIFGNLYAFSFIDFRHHLRPLNILKVTMISIYLLGIIGVFFSMPWFFETPLNYILITTKVFNALFLFFFPLYYYIRFKVNEALVYGLAYLVVGLAVIYTNLSFYITDLIYIPAGNSLIVGLILEITILTLYIVLKYKSTENQRLSAEKKIAEAKIKNQVALITGQEIEKRRIALNLHDNIGSSIVSIKQELEMLGAQYETPAIDNLQSEVKRISQEVRNISHELLPVTLEEVGLAAATEELIRKNEGVVFHFNELTPTYSFIKDDAVQLYRILQELVKNTLQHAHAKNVSIQFLTEKESFQLTYEDDGIGFEKSVFKKGLGFKSLETRVGMLGGSYFLESAPEKGVLVIIKVPLKNHGFGDSRSLQRS